MDETARQKLKDKLSAIDEAVTRDELKKAIEAMLQFEKNLGKKTEAELTAIKQAVDSAIERMHAIAVKEAESATEQARAELMAKFDEDMSKMILEHEAMMAECEKKMSEITDGADGLNGSDGADADEEEIIARILPQLPKPKEPEFTQKDKVALMAEIDSLKTRLSGIRTAPLIAPNRGIFLKVNGVKQGVVYELDVVGSGVSITKVNGLPTVTITGGSGATAVETPTGAVDGANTSYTVAHTPLYIIVDGISKFLTLHYTYAAGTITITDGAPPVQYIRSVYSA